MKASIGKWLPWVAGVLLASGLFVLLDRQEASFGGWLAYFVLSGCSALLIVLFWRSLFRGGAPRSISYAFVIAVALRLAIGIGLFHALPEFGYDEEPQRAGYIFFDAYNRDVDSFQLARSEQPLTSAFTEPSGKDQYGGLKFLSAFVYRYLSPDVRRPFLIMLLSALVSALSILTTWGFVSVTFGSKAADVAAWVLAFFPDAVLLGASQMREPFIIFALSLAMYGYARMRQKDVRRGALIVLAAALFILPISPPYTFVILGMLGLIWVWEGRVGFLRAKWLLFVLLAAVLVALVFVIRSWSRIEGLSGNGFQVLLEWFKSLSASDKLAEIFAQSDWTRHLFRSTPEWAHFPVMVLYGVFRPFLPGALIDSGAPVWRIIAIWRGLGWFSMLPFLLYAPVAAIRKHGWRSLPSALSLITWGTIVLSSYRGAGDQWDNPRYRTAFIVLHAALVGWAWVTARDTKSPWLSRMGLLVFIVTALFTLWYGYRSRMISFFTPLHAMASIAAFIVLYMLFHLARDRIRSRGNTA